MLKTEGIQKLRFLRKELVIHNVIALKIKKRLTPIIGVFYDLQESELATIPDVVTGFLYGTGLEISKVGLESGSLTHWLTKGLRSLCFDVVPIESRKMATILATVVNKTDENDAKGRLLRLFEQVIIKSVYIEATKL